jgi:glycosyltransferase involved in cell wall biosynthesis
VRIALADPVSYTIPYDRSLAAALAERGNDVDLFRAAFLFADLEPVHGYREHEVFLTRSARLLRGKPRSRLRFLAKGLEYVPDTRRFVRTIARLDPDVVHVQWLGLPGYDLRWLRSIARDRPVVFTAHDLLPRRTASKVDLWREVFETVDRVIVHGAAAVEQLEVIGVDPARIVRVPHPTFSPPRPLSPPRGTTLLFFGLIRASKGLDLLVRALPEIAGRVPDVRLVVAGDPLEPAEPLQRLAVELGVADRIDWRLRYLGENEVAAVMDEASAVVLPYRSIESSGVLATALGYGRPAVVTDVGSLGATVREYGAGVVAAGTDPSAIAAACTALLEDARLRTRAVRGAEAARKALSWESAAGTHEAVYGEALAERGLR